MQNDEFKIVFRGKGLDELKDLAKSYNIPEQNLGDVVVKAIKLLKITKDNKSVSFSEGDRQITVDTKNL